MPNGGSQDSQAYKPPIPAIQPRGWAIICDAQAAHVLGHSANLAGLLPAREGVFVGAALRDLVGSETSHALRNALSRASAAPRPSLLPFRHIAGCEGAFDFAVHGAGDQTIIEIERATEPDLDALDRARALVDRLSRSDGLDKLALMAARLVFSVLQWDCVTILRLAPEGAAHTLAQHKRPDWPDAAQNAALSAEFSAEARAFYLGARLRFLSDSAAPPVELIGAPAPDLALAHLRATTDDESARAAKAGFAALLSMPIRVEGELWGLFLAHDRQPRSLNINERAVFELFGDFLSLSVQSALWRQGAVESRRPRAL
jgi:light-regulated signal transduction histidine kinase (bacteriophytochrome)